MYLCIRELFNLRNRGDTQNKFSECCGKVSADPVKLEFFLPVPWSIPARGCQGMLRR